MKPLFVLLSFLTTILCAQAPKVELVKMNDVTAVFRVTVKNKNLPQVVETSRTFKDREVVYDYVVYIAENGDCLKYLYCLNNREMNKKIYRAAANIFRQENPQFDWREYNINNYKK